MMIITNLGSLVIGLLAGSLFGMWRTSKVFAKLLKALNEGFNDSRQVKQR